MICILYKNNAVIQFLSLLILHISFHKYGILLDPFNLPPWLLFQERLNPIFCQKKRPPRANPRRSENPLFMRFINDYSMIVATLPEPTVLPPSRYQTGVLQCANGDFSCDFPLCPCSFWRFCYHGVITISLYLSTYLYLYYLKMVSIVEHTLN